MQYFVNEILENEDIKTILLSETARYDEAKKVADKIIETLNKPELEDGVFPVLVLGFLADYALEVNTKRGIPKYITTQTLKDINLWIHNYFVQYNKLGIEQSPAQLGWLTRHYTGRIFRIGRLQFNIRKANKKIPDGEYVIETHVPQGEPLDLEKCNQSFDMAKEFFEKHFPQIDAKYFTFHSWLANPNLEKLLSADSNIVKFMKLWTLVDDEGDNSEQAIERVFGLGFKIEDIQNAPENTSLQRKLKEYIISGGNMDIKYGYKKI